MAKAWTQIATPADGPRLLARGRAGPTGSRRDEAFDAEIRDKFLPTYEAAVGRQARDWEGDRRGRARARDRARPVPAQHVPRRCAHLRGRSARARGRATARSSAATIRTCRETSAAFFFLPFMHSEDAGRPAALRRALSRGGRRRRAEIRARAARRHHPPFRPLPASQCRCSAAQPRRRSRPSSTAAGSRARRSYSPTIASVRRDGATGQTAAVEETMRRLAARGRGRSVRRTRFRPNRTEDHGAGRARRRLGPDRARDAAGADRPRRSCAACRW